MPITVTMPALSPTMTEGNLAKWIKKEGDTVSAGDVIAEIETDKATMEVEAVDEGILGKILVAEGSQGVAVNTPIALLVEEGEDASAAAEGALSASSAVILSGSEGSRDVVAPDSSASPQNDTVNRSASTPKTEGRVFATPLARRIAKEKGVDLSALKGSGPHGRIVKADIMGAKGGAVSAAPAAAVAQPQRSASPAGSSKAMIDALGMAYTEQPNSGVRKVIARRLSESKQTIPHFYLTVECRIDALLAARAELNAAGKDAYKLSVNDFIIKAAAMALKAYPAANVSWTEEAILQFAQADISVAVATPNGLMTPIVKAAETKGLAQISAEVKDLAKRARDGKLKPEEFQGGTFTVSNLGMYGIKDFGAIINPPQSCILAVGAGIEQPVVSGGKIEVGTVMNCTLSVDHRSVDGAVGAEWLQIFKRYIENPVSMLV